MIQQSGEGKVVVGRSCSIGEVSVVFSKPGSLTLGDYITLGDGVRIVIDGGSVTIGDWTTLHPGCLVLAGLVEIGQHCWFGQNCVIDGTGELRIGNGVRVGMYSQIWSHVAAGEQIEGCTLFGTAPVTIEDDAWLVGTCTVGSGVTIGRKAIALAGSNVTKSVAPETVVAGAPAKLKEGLAFYKTLTLDEKFELLEGWLRELPAEIVRTDEALSVIMNEGRVVFHKTAAAYEAAKSAHGVTHCCLESKSYRKAFTPAEKTVLKSLAGNRARFYDRG